MWLLARFVSAKYRPSQKTTGFTPYLQWFMLSRKNKIMQRRINTIVILLITALLVSCTIGSKPNRALTQEEFFKDYFNLTPLPSGISEFRIGSSEKTTIFSTHGYYRYKADPSFFDILLTHNSFSEESEINQSIHSVKCSKLPEDFSYWTNEKIELKGKACYIGIFTPYIHYIIFDQMTHDVYHFYDWVRD